MAEFHNQGSVANQTHTQHVHGSVHHNYNYAPSTTKPLTYDLGVRLGQAPRITEDYFIGRERELEQLQTWLEPTSGKQSIVVLHGMGGIGKTQLSLKFVRQACAKYTMVYWLNASDEKTLKAGLAAMAIEVSELSTAVTDAHDEEELVQQARQWLSRPDNDRWLLLYDNYDDPKLPGVSSSTAYDIFTYFPPRAHGSILITTRSPRLTFGKQLRLKKLDDQGHSLLILSTRSGRSAATDPAAIDLVQRLDGLPLALATAGKYLSQSADSFEDYLQLHISSWNHLKNNDHGPDDYGNRTLYSTWNISYQRVQDEDVVAGELLALMAYFDNQDLWYELFHAGHDLVDAPIWWREATQNRSRFQRAVTILQNYSLLEMHSGGYSLHPCIHDWTLEHLNREISDERYRIAIHSVAKSVSREMEEEYWIRNRRIIPHARRLQHFRFQDVTEKCVITPNDQICLEHFYQMNDMYQEAEQMYKRALAGKEKALGAEHISTLITVNHFGLLYTAQGKLAEAEQMYLRALAGMEKALGAEHTSTLNTVHYLGLLYTTQGKPAEAEQLYLRALARTEKALGPEHTSTLDTIHNLGLLYTDQGKLIEAEQMYLRALAGKEKALGAEHISTLDTVNNLGFLYHDQGKLAEAEQMYLRALAGMEKALGAEHTSTLNTVKTLGLLYRDQGKLTEAEQMYLRALAGREKAFGAMHRSTLHAVHSLGIFYYNQGELAKAEQHLKRAAIGLQQVLGVDHSDTKGVIEDIEELNLTLHSKQDDSQQVRQSGRKRDRFKRLIGM